MVPSETRESLDRRSGVGNKFVSATSDKILPASEEKKLRLLTILGQLLEKVRTIRFCDAVAELGVSVHEGEQMRVL